MPTTYKKHAHRYIVHGTIGRLNSTTTPVAYPTPTWNDVRIAGNNIPNYKALIAAHVSATTSLSAGRRILKVGNMYAMLVRERNDGPGKYTLTDEVSGPDTAQLIGNLPDPPTSVVIPTSLSNVVHAQFLKRLYSMRQKCQAGTILGELRQTIGMIRRPAESLRNGFADYVRSCDQRTRRRGLRRSSVVRILKDTWLEYVFGWKPLISDTKAIAETLAERVEQLTQEFESVSAKSTTLISGNPPTAQAVRSVSPPGVNIQYFWIASEESRKLSYRLKGQIRAKVPDPRQFDRDLFGFNLENFGPTVWELIPWSFAIDYFSNVSDVVNSLSYPTASICWICRSQRQDSKVNIVARKRDPQLNAGDKLISYQFSAGPTNYSTTAVSRSSMSPWAIAVFLDFRLPSLRQVVNLEALRGAERRVTQRIRHL
jgi:hypothetical protein